MLCGAHRKPKGLNTPIQTAPPTDAANCRGELCSPILFQVKNAIPATHRASTARPYPNSPTDPLLDEQPEAIGRSWGVMDAAPYEIKCSRLH